MFTAEATEQNQILKEGSEQFAETIKEKKAKQYQPSVHTRPVPLLQVMDVSQ